MKKKVLVVVISIIALIAILWITGVIPKIIGTNTAKKYVNENYKEMNLEYETIEFSSAYGDYIVRFVDENNNTYNFMVSPKYIPIEIMYDSIESNTEENNNSTTTEPYIPNGMDVADGNEKNNSSNTKEYNRKIENVKLEIKEGTLSNTGATVIITDKNENPYGWGVPYFIEVNKNGEWIELENLLDFAWEEIAYELDENGQYEQKINWKVLYGELVPGNYRLGKGVYDNNEYVKFYVEFTIE